jgi:hypothetical protein
MIWLAGATRFAGQQSYIGFHAAYNSTTNQPTAAGNALAGAYLRELGFKFDAIAWLINAPADKMD